MLKIELKEKPKENAVLIEGFPGLGFVSTIATEFLIKHLNAKPIGKIFSTKLEPVAAIHKNEVLHPLQIFYSKNENIVIVQAIVPVDGLEWEIADAILKLAKKIKAKEIISLEGVSSPIQTKDSKVFFFSKWKEKNKILQKFNIPQLEEGIIIGVTGALLMTSNIPLSCFFVETHSKLQDNAAAAKLIEALDMYLNLKVDYTPLLEKAREFEEKLKKILSSVTATKDQKEQKELTYMG
ncbi:MAG: PAC2 family protein [Candidatus Pacearchaeota archaeon]|nr:PAC2 family protein [Candidatus Pacearchaeota archaeon]